MLGSTSRSVHKCVERRTKLVFGVDFSQKSNRRNSLSINNLSVKIGQNAKQIDVNWWFQFGGFSQSSHQVDLCTNVWQVGQS